MPRHEARKTTLFDEIDRTDEEPREHAEPRVHHLNRSAETAVGRIRQVLELWFSRYPAAERTQEAPGLSRSLSEWRAFLHGGRSRNR